MKKIILIILLSISLNTVNAENIYSGLRALEKNIFQETYEYEIPQTRIERLETKIFGALQQGSMEDRYILLKNASKNYKAYNLENNRIYDQYRPPIFTGSSGGNWKSLLLGNFKNQFSGYPTGLTPSLKPGMDPAYMDYFEAERALSKNGYYNDYRTPRGYQTTRTDRGSRSSVTILD